MRRRERAGGRARRVSNRTWWLRARREGNPLLHRVSFVERAAVAMVALLGVTLVVGALVAVLAVSASTRQVAARQAGDRHQVTATVLGQSPIATGTAGVRSIVPYDQRVRWVWANRPHIGHTTVTTTAPQGSTRQVWVDDSGALATPPVTTGDSLLIAALTGVGAALAAGCVFAAAVWLLRGWLLRRRMRAWHEEWALVAPMWTGRSGRF